MATLAELGERLRKTRETQELALPTLAAKTGLPERYLRAMEAGDLNALPNEVYARIYYLSYARALGANTEQLLLDWPLAARERPAPVASGAKLLQSRRRVWGGTLLAGALALVVWGSVTWLEDDPTPDSTLAGSFDAYTDEYDTDDYDRGGPVPPESTTLVGPDSTQAVLTEPEQASEPPPAETVPVARHTLVLAALLETWVVIEADGDTVEALVLRTGRRVTATASREFVVTMASPQSVQVWLDDRRWHPPVEPGRAMVRQRIVVTGEQET